MDEEAKVRLGLDIAPFQQNLRQAQRELSVAGDGMHKSFLHAGSAAKGFKNLLHEISADSPIMGTALRFAISPIVGAFAAATLAAGFFKGKIDEINELSNALEKGMSDPAIKTRENLRTAKNALAEFQREQAKWLRDLKANDHTINKQLADRLVLLNAQSKELEKLAKARGGSESDLLNIERQRLQIQLQLQRAALQSANTRGMDLEGRMAVQTTDIKLLDKKQLGAKAAQLNKQEADEQARIQLQLDALKKEAFSPSGALLGGVRSLLGGESAEERAKRITEAADELHRLMKASKARVERNNDVIDRENMARKTMTEAINASRSKIGTNHEFLEQLKRDVIGTTRELSYLPGQSGGSLYQPFDWGAFNASKDAKRLEMVQKNDLAYRIAHMNDPRSAAGTPEVTLETLSAEIKKELVDLNTKVAKGIDVFPIGSE